MEPECIIISEGTLRSDDLFEAFVAYLETVRPFNTEWFREEWKDADEFNRDFLLNENLFDAMDEAAPPGMYFGASEGDGACFGYWPIVEPVDENEDAMWEM